MIEFLQPIAARIGVVALFIFTVCWSMRTIAYRKKIGFVILSLVVIVGVQSIEFNKNVVERQRRFDQIDAENVAASRLKDQQAEDAFNNMTPAQHLAAAKDSLQVEAPSDQISEGMKHLAALHGTSAENQGNAVRNHYEAEQQQAQKAQAATAAASAAKQKIQDAEAQEILREAYAKTFEDNMLGQGMNVDVNSMGPQHTTLRVRWVLATKADAYQITTTDQDLLNEMRDLGFKKFVVWDGYDNSWSWTLNK
jgi:hypothetical protein